MNEKTVAAIMAEIGIEGISPRTFTLRSIVVGSVASFPPDLACRRFDQGQPNAVWLTDITYLTCGESDMYLCADPGWAFPSCARARCRRPHRR